MRPDDLGPRQTLRVALQSLELKIACLITFGSSQGDFGITRPNIRRESVIETFQCPNQAEPLHTTISFAFKFAFVRRDAVVVCSFVA